MQGIKIQEPSREEAVESSVAERVASFLARSRDIAAVKEAETDLTTPAVEFRNVSFAYGDQKVLDDVSFKLAKGEIKIILSSSGGGQIHYLKTDPGPIEA